MTRDDWIAVFVTLATTAMLAALYFMVLKPEIVVPMAMAGPCPDGWVFDQTKSLCTAAYTPPSTCKSPYDPTTQLTTYAEKCAFATQCGTTWSGLCA